MTRPTSDESVRTAILTIIFVAIMAAIIWWLSILWDSATPQPARTYHSVVSHSMRPTMSAREQVALATIKRGWDYEQLQCLVALINVENHDWSPTVRNSRSTASGLFQMVRSPSGVMARDLSVKDQARLGAKYIANRYGSPCKALRHERRVWWY